MNIKRILNHLVMTHWQVKRAFPPETLIAIEQAIKASEAAHAGEIRFVVEGALDSTPLFKGQSARERAIDVFSQLRIWDTAHNNGVLIYLLLADRDVEIVADRGIHAKAGPQEWQSICRQMEAAFKDANYKGGVVSGIQAVTQHLIKHFPVAGGEPNELPDKPMVL
ncbi:TPM domain-containing protein [Pseudomonas fluorescens]|uniref:Membrane protein n=1 Tax=Pseudomonas fluorescens TaxID=294 RepID=A0A0F4V7Y6_PSEFL|nr:TPM domain-containing protein [Pseudomonas fluorescens]KJZ64615.1 membrane protein [Pseudomonas fluorescens]